MSEQFIEFQPGPGADIPPSTYITPGESHQAKIDALDQARVEAFGIPPLPTDGSFDGFGALRVWLAKDSGHFTGDRTHGTLDDPGYNGQSQVSDE